MDADEPQPTGSSKDFYKVLGVTKDATPDRDQEGLPQARARATTPTPTRATTRSRGALQGDLRGLRRPRPTPRSARSTTRRARCSAGGPAFRGGFGGGGGRPAAAVRPRRPASAAAAPAASATCSATSSAAASAQRSRRPQRPAARGADVETDGDPRLHRRDRRRHRLAAADHRRAVPDCQGTGGKPGTMPHICPTCEGAGFSRVRSRRRASRSPRPCRDVPRPPAGRRRAVPDLPRHRPRLSARTHPGAHPGRASRTASGSGCAARARPGEHGGPAGDLFVTVHGHARTGCSAARATTSPSTCRSPSTRPRSAPRSRSRPSAARRSR